MPGGQSGCVPIAKSMLEASVGGKIIGNVSVDFDSIKGRHPIPAQQGKKP